MWILSFVVWYRFLVQISVKNGKMILKYFVNVPNNENAKIPCKSVKRGLFNNQNGKSQPLFVMLAWSYEHIFITKCSFKFMPLFKCRIFLENFWEAKTSGIFQNFQQPKIRDSCLTTALNLHLLVKANRVYLQKLTMIAAHPYLWPKSSEYDITIVSFAFNLSGSRKMSLDRMCELLKKRVSRVWWEYLLSFVSYRKTSGGGRPPTRRGLKRIGNVGRAAALSRSSLFTQRIWEHTVGLSQEDSRWCWFSATFYLEWKLNSSATSLLVLISCCVWSASDWPFPGTEVWSPAAVRSSGSSSNLMWVTVANVFSDHLSYLFKCWKAFKAFIGYLFIDFGRWYLYTLY